MYDPDYDITLTADGSAPATGGPGGWAVVMRARDGQHKELAGAADWSSSHNEMELTAIYAGLDAIRWRDITVLVRSDSQCALGWASGAFMRRRAYVHRLCALIDTTITEKGLTVEWRYVKGHGDDGDNIRADRLAGQARRHRIRALRTS